MEFFKKIYGFLSPVLFVFFWLIINQLDVVDNSFIKIGIPIVLAFILSPKVKIVQKQHGKEEQIKWLFFTKVIDKKI